MGKLSVVLGSVTVGVEQGRRLLEMAEGIVKANLKVFQIVLDLQKYIMRIPCQVDRQQSVYLIDALGRHQPFHLEFILSAEAFIAVLKANFKNIGPATLKMKGENLLSKTRQRNETSIYPQRGELLSSWTADRHEHDLYRSRVSDVILPRMW
jgi:hypothetical protein